MTPTRRLPQAGLLSLALLLASGAPAFANDLAMENDTLTASVVAPAVAASAMPATVFGLGAASALAAQVADPVSAAAEATRTAAASAAEQGEAPDALPEPPPASDTPPETTADAQDPAAEADDPTAYDPIADATLPPPAQRDPSYDPWEKFNRRMHRVNNAIDRGVAKPLATAYVRVIPRPVRLGVSNFFNNLGQPVSAVNALLQGKPKQASQSVGRFLLNSTLGIGGIFDPATAAKLPNRSEDFGQTLGVWGWKRSRYVELPLFGPRTVRDVFGMVGDAPLSPSRHIEEDRVRVFLQGLQLVDLRAQLMSTDSFREGAADDYALVRDAWLQRRNYQINGDDAQQSDEGLPDYLQDEGDPTIPVDAMPVPVPGAP